MRVELQPAIRRANVRLASILGLIALGFFVLFFCAGWL